MKIQFLLIGYLLILYLGMTNISCSNHSEEKPSKDLVGENLARQYCSTCHEFVAPRNLVKDYWRSVLMRMSANLGFSRGDPYYGKTKIAQNRLASAHIFPDSQIISTEDWQRLVLYYLDHAPDSLDQGQRPAIDNKCNQFKPKIIPWKTPLNGLTYLEIKDKNQILAGFNYQSDSNKLHLIDMDGQSLNEIKLPSAIVDLKPDINSTLNYLVCMGPFEADDTPTGTVILNNFNNNKAALTNHKIVLAQRERPVHLTISDLDTDGQQDLLLSEFGKFLGGLHWYRRKREGDWTKEVLYAGPGALTTKIRDINGDGKPDIFALISQGNEGIYLYTNQGNGRFEEKKILKFPPFYGSVSFELFDFDNDGLEDILYLNGDSGDFGHPAKPFHGIRFFQNAGNLEFKEKWFYPQQGCYDISIADFDQDGDPDIASIGFFAMASGMPEEGFLYLENPGQVTVADDFKTYSFEQAKSTSFMVMDQGDIDGDGDIDIILGASTSMMSVSEKVEQLVKWQSQGGAIYLLENTLY